MNATLAIAYSVLIEAFRRREIYVLVLLCCALIGVVMSLDFFELAGLTKFYREIALQMMGITTALTVIVLGARQLPREFSNRTIYPLLARPIGRMQFLAGKLLGVFLSAIFCYLLFMVIFTAGVMYLGDPMAWGLFFQHIYLQLLLMLLLASLSFLLSMLMNLDAAITLGILFYVISNAISAAMVMLYEHATAFGRIVLTMLNYGMPQALLFDLSEKVVHSELWGPISLAAMAALTAYAAVYSSIFFGGAYLLFRRKPL